MKIEMSGTALLLGLMLWGGGVITWAVATLFEHQWRHRRYERRKAELQGACNASAEFAATVNNIDAYLADHGEPRPSFWHCFFFTAFQPLLILTIIAIPTFRPWDFDSWVASVVNVFATVGIFILTCYHEYLGKDEFIEKRRYRALIVFLWSASLAMILWIAHISEDSPANEKNQHKPAASDEKHEQKQAAQPESAETDPNH